MSQAYPDVERLALSDSRLDRFVAAYPHAPYVIPFMTFLVLMALGGIVGDDWKTSMYFLRCAASLVAALIFWRYLPPMGKLHPVLCIVVGLLTAVGWVVIHHWFAGFDWYRSTQFMVKDPLPEEQFNPNVVFADSPLRLWTFLIIRIGGASTVVPIIEEIFWRIFILRLLIDLDSWEEVPIGKFTWFSYIGCSLMSALEHPQWEVGILCWMAWNLLFYYTKSLKCLIVTHGITNFSLYVYVYVYQDWIFW